VICRIIRAEVSVISPAERSRLITLTLFVVVVAAKHRLIRTLKGLQKVSVLTGSPY